MENTLTAPGEVRVHFGLNRGLRLDELNAPQVAKLTDDWLPKKEAQLAPLTLADMRLAEALRALRTA